MTLYGTDMSHYDAAPATLGARLVSEGFSFATHKAGGDANDAELHAFWTALKDHRDKLLVGFYWVLYPGSPVARADTFLARLDAQCPGWRDKPTILQVDCEKWGGKASTVPSKADIKAFCDHLKAKTGLVPIVYGPKWVYANGLSGLGYPLWASSYVDGSGAASKLYPGDKSSRWGAYSGQTPAILQFTSSATIAGQTTCDANAYRGTLAQLTALVAPKGKATTSTPKPSTTATGKLSVNGVLNTATVKAEQAALKVAVDGVEGSVTIRAEQKRTGAGQDGKRGTVTNEHLQRYLNTKMGTKLAVDGDRGPATVKVLQAALNADKF